MLALVIDDSRPVRSILSKMLRGWKYETVEAENGREALDRLRDLGTPDLFLVNWNMPEVDGLHFIRKVRSVARYTEVPLIVISADSSESTVAKASLAGANAYLVKPVTANTLRSNLAKLGVTLPTLPEPEPAKPESSSVPTDVSLRRSATPPAIAVVPSQSTTQPIVARYANLSAATIRILVVDDSVVVRGIISKILGSDPELEVVATAADGQIALSKMKKQSFDVVLLDIEMPRMNGFDVLKTLKLKRDLTPVIMFSSLTERGGPATIEALMLGAKDYVMKPGGAYMADTTEGKRAIETELIPKIKQFGPRAKKVSLGKNASVTLAGSRSMPAKMKSRVEIVVVGVSTGGPQALASLLPKLRSDFPVPVLIVQHMPVGFTKHLANRLTQDCGFPVTEATHGEPLRRQQFLIAPGGVHLKVARKHGKVVTAISEDPPVNACRPAADLLFSSASAVYGRGVLGVVLTGMGADGMIGSQAITESGGEVIVQDESSSVVWGMPGSVVRAGLADRVLSLDQLAGEIVSRAWAKRTPINKREGSGN
ncbi:MAG: chemotaxis-specific protein-glutamate methyltransferase CheB [Rubripirellula sp.]